MSAFSQNLRYSTRKLLHAPGFTIITVSILAIAVGATTAMFSIVYGVLLQPLPFKDPSGVVKIASARKNPKTGIVGPAAMSPLDFLDYRKQSHTVSAMAGIDFQTLNLTSQGGEPTRVSAARVSDDFFSILGIQPEAGRFFATGDDKPSAPKTVILSDAYWRNHFGGDRSVINKPLTLDGREYTVIGVAKPDLDYPAKTDAWVPLQFSNDDMDPNNRGAHSLNGIGRLAPGATVEQANQELHTIAARLAAQYPQTNTGFDAGAYDLHAQIVKNVNQALFALLASVGFVLLIACANVANVLLVRAAGRDTEIAVRTALGATRWQVVQQLMIEGGLLAVAGAAIGMGLASWAVEAVVAFGPQALPRLDAIHVDGHVMLFGVVVAIVTGLFFGAVPAAHVLNPSVSGMLRSGARGASSRRAAQRTRNGLVVIETALAVMLLTGAGLFIKSFASLAQVDLGFKTDHVEALDVSLPGKRYPNDHDDGRFAAQLLTAVRASPGVKYAAVTFNRPLEQSGFNITFDVDGWPKAPPGARQVAQIRSVSSGYFQTLGVPLAKGREFTADDRAGSQPVAIVSQELVKEFFKGQDPIGKRVVLGWGRDPKEWGADSTVTGTIVGVAGDVKQFGANNDTPPLLYFPFDQAPLGDVSLLVRSSGSPASVVGLMRQAVHNIDAELPAYNIQSMDEAAAESVSQPRFYTTLLSAFAFVALLLSALGIYGVVSYGVTQRVRELGIRIALGATHDRVVKLVVGQGLVLAAAGVALGLIGARLLTSTVSSLLFGVKGTDVVTFVVVGGTLLAVAGVASFVPALRAARVDPAITIRAE